MSKNAKNGDERQRLTRLKHMAAILDISPSTLYRLVKTGEVKALRIGRVWRFDVDETIEALRR